jgi:hypothetical protein
MSSHNNHNNNNNVIQVKVLNNLEEAKYYIETKVK